MIKVIRLKTIKRIIYIIAVIILITALFKWKFSVYANTGNEYKILVDVEDSKLFLFENDSLIKTYKCSGGKWSTPSPIGTWKITFKAKWGEGFRTEVFQDLMYLGDNLEYMEHQIKILQAGQVLIGCIRMKNSEVAELYKIIPIGTQVTIVDGIYGPFGKGFRNLKSGMYGSDVMEIQKKLKELGFFTRHSKWQIW